jgi:hypothetical protein
MIPMLALIDIRHPRGGFRLWAPLFLLWLLLAPFALLVLPLAMIALPLVRVNPFYAAAVLGRLACALSGTLVEVDSPQTSVVIKIF